MRMRHQTICSVRQEIKQEKIHHGNTLVVGYLGNLISQLVHIHDFSKNFFDIFEIVQKSKYKYFQNSILV